ncbi:MAG: 16S rRNA (guanine(527)-N(7))-methyltransferase RsmG [Thermoanaerobaculia bacterium]|nr:16S rRNA (guanine(527)-N(7))-methyltransferase RsmG [Thermoanaerobaculia bacterium]
MSPEGAPSPPEAFRDLLAASAPRFALSLPPDTFDALSRFLAELDRWRRAMDLTGPLTAPELADHALESALGANLLPPGASVLDIGSGAGFPGVPLAVCRPDLSVSALEPRSKRSEFLRHVSRSVPVSNLEVVRGRLENLDGGPFAAATSRAVGHVAELAGEAPFLVPEGLLLVWTTDEEALSRELSPVFRLERVERVPGSRRRAIAVFRKAAHASRQGSKERNQGVFPVERSG